MQRQIAIYRGDYLRTQNLPPRGEGGTPSGVTDEGPAPQFAENGANEWVSTAPLIRPFGAPSPQGEGFICPTNWNLVMGRMMQYTI